MGEEFVVDELIGEEGECCLLVRVADQFWCLMSVGYW